MKTIFCLLVLAFSTQALALDYTCNSTDGTTTNATLTVTSAKEIYWNDESHGASSKGIYTSVDRAPYSIRQGQLQYQLTSFAMSDDSSYVMSVPASIQQAPATITVTEFYNNDDHAENETVLNCTKN